MIKYIALDTETYKGKAFLLSCSAGVFQIKSFRDFIRAIEMLSRVNQTNLFCFFNLDYDISALLKHLGKTAVEKIYLEKTYPYGNDSCLDYLPGKYLKLRIKNKVYHFYDIYPFFQTSLDECSEKYLGDKKRKIPKNLIKDLSPAKYRKFKTRIDSYAIKDADITQRLVDMLVAALEECGLKPDKLFSPGFQAKRYLRKFGYRPRFYSGRELELIQDSYFGAHVVTYRRGYFKRVYIYDIRSAYPSVMAQLPDLHDCKLKLSKKVESDWFIAKVKVWTNPNDTIQPLPFVHREVLKYPVWNGEETVCTSIEILELQRLKKAKFEFIEVLNIFPSSSEPVYSDLIIDLFERRKESGMAGMVFKLMLNSLYGIFAERIPFYEKVGFMRGVYAVKKNLLNLNFQNFLIEQSRKCSNAPYYYLGECKCNVCKSIRLLIRSIPKRKGKNLFQHEKEFYEKLERRGKMTNLLLASFITAGSRIKIYESLLKAGKSAIAAFTDSIITSKPLKLDFGSNLGQFEKKYVGWCLVIGSGIYQTGIETKRRGYKTKKDLASILKLKKNLRRKFVNIKSLERKGAGKIVRQGMYRFSEFNELFDNEKVLDLNFDEKRDWDSTIKNCEDLVSRNMNSKPFLLDNLKKKL